MTTEEGIQLSPQQAKAIYAALLMRPTIDRQLAELTLREPAWAKEKPKIKTSYEKLVAIYQAYAPPGSDPWPPPFPLEPIPKQIHIFTKHGPVSVANRHGGP